MKKNDNKEFKSKFWKPLPNENILINKSFFNNYGFDKHIHEEFAIGVIEKGYMDGFVDGRIRSINEASIMTINPDTAHSNWSRNNNSYTQAALYLNKSFIETLAKTNFETKDIYFKAGLLEDSSLAKEFLNLISSYEKNELTSIDYECKLIEILNKILLCNTKVQTQKILTKHDIAIYKAKEIMNDKLNEDLTLDEISKELDISKYHFLRLFKEYTHFSPHSYLMLKRLEKAKIMLQKGYAIIEVAYSCGFNDQSHLNRRFKACVGITPKEYQKFFI